MILANPWVLRLAPEKQPPKPRLASLEATPPAMFVLPQGQVRLAAPAGFSSVHDGKHCWLRWGAHRAPITQT